MSKTHATKKGNKKDIFQKVTDIVIEHLEQGEIMWKMPWCKFGQPKNYKTGLEYSGFIRFFLNMSMYFNNYKTPYFLTFKQAKDMGGNVKKGEKGQPIVYWAGQRIAKEVEVEKNGKKVKEKTYTETSKRFPCGHTVFNLDQIEGIEIPDIEEKIRTETQIIASCEKIIEEMPKKPEIETHGEEAYYSPLFDRVNMPPISRFRSNEGYYQVLFHELGHSTGHQSRLNRKEVAEASINFGSSDYSKEELVAEMTSAFLSGYCGIILDNFKNSSAYIQGWLKALNNDKSLLVSSASRAEKAANFILNNK